MSVSSGHDDGNGKRAVWWASGTVAAIIDMSDEDQTAGSADQCRDRKGSAIGEQVLAERKEELQGDAHALLMAVYKDPPASSGSRFFEAQKLLNTPIQILS